MNAPYFIACLPRSRSAWLANLLTYGPSFCFHDQIIKCENMDVLRASMASTGCRFAGDADPSIGLFADQVLDKFSSAKFVFVHRPFEECAESEYRAMIEDGSLDFDGVTRKDVTDKVRIAQEGLDRLYKAIPLSRKMWVQYSDLDRMASVHAVWRFCVPGVEFSVERWKTLSTLRVTQIFSKAVKLIRNEAILENAGANA